MAAVNTACAGRRSLHRERGLKPLAPKTPHRKVGRSLHRERGLKHRANVSLGDFKASLPSPGAWIETSASALIAQTFRRSLHRERGLKHRSADLLNALR